MKKILRFLLLSTFLLASIQQVQAQDSYIFDEYDLFSKEQEDYYDQLASDFEKQYDVQAFLLNLETTSEDPSEAAKDVYLHHSNHKNVVVMAYSDTYYVILPFGNMIPLIHDQLFNVYYQQSLTIEERFQAYFEELTYLVTKTDEKKENPTITNSGSLFVDDADLFDEDSEQQLLVQMEQLSKRLDIDVVGVTTNNMNGVNAEQYARQYYQDHLYDHDGIILMIDMEDRQWGLVSIGEMKNVFVKDVRDIMSDEFVPYLSDGDYQEAFNLYTSQVDKYVSLYQKYGSAYLDELAAIEYEDNKGTYFLMGSGIGIVVGLIISAIVLAVLYGQCKMVKMQTQAKDYLVKNSMKMTRSQDLFLYSNVVRTKRASDDDNSSSSSSDSGGSSGSF